MNNNIPSPRSSALRLVVALSAVVATIAAAAWIARYFVNDQATVRITLNDLPRATAPASSELNVTAQLISQIAGNSLSIRPSNDNFGIAVNTGTTRTLRVEYAIDGSPGVRWVSEGQMLNITAAPGKKLQIRSAIYGFMPAQKDRLATGDVGLPTGVADVTQLVKRAVNANGLMIAATNDTFGDPASGQAKLLRVEYLIDGSSGVQFVPENQTLTIAAASGKKLEIRKALYGVMPDGRIMAGPSAGVVDVTKLLQDDMNDNSLTTTAGNPVFGGDPAPFKMKALRVDYAIDGSLGIRFAKEGQTLNIAAAPGKHLKIRKATYGALPVGNDTIADGDVGHAATEASIDVTHLLHGFVQHNQLTIVAGNGTMGGDPAFGVSKRLTVQYTVAGKPHSATAGEGESLELPSHGDGEGLLVIVKATWDARR